MGHRCDPIRIAIPLRKDDRQVRYRRMAGNSDHVPKGFS
jgi:hypothetical protein